MLTQQVKGYATIASLNGMDLEVSQEAINLALLTKIARPGQYFRCNHGAGLQTSGRPHRQQKLGCILPTTQMVDNNGSINKQSRIGLRVEG